MEKQRAIFQELMATAKDMLRNTEVAVRSFMMVRPRFLHSSMSTPASGSAPSQGSGAMITQSSAAQPAGSSLVPIFDFYSGVPRKPSPFLQETVGRFEKYIAECLQWIEELEQLILLDSDRTALNSSSSLLLSLPKVMANVHDFFVHVAAKVKQQVCMNNILLYFHACHVKSFSPVSFTSCFVMAYLLVCFPPCIVLLV